jgi:hypothetical protein
VRRVAGLGGAPPSPSRCPSRCQPPSPTAPRAWTGPVAQVVLLGVTAVGRWEARVPHRLPATQQRPAADTGERGSCVAGAALYCSPVRLRPGVRCSRLSALAPIPEKRYNDSQSLSQPREKF